MPRTTLLEAQRQLVGRNVRKARQSRGFSHDELGRRVGTSRQHLIKIEKGRHLPGEVLLAKIAEETGVDADSFFVDDTPDEAESSEDDMEAALASVIRRIVRAETHEFLKERLGA